MTKGEKDKMRAALAVSAHSAHKAYMDAKGAAERFGLNCQNIQHIYYADGRDKIHSVMINGELKK